MKLKKSVYCVPLLPPVLTEATQASWNPWSWVAVGGEVEGDSGRMPACLPRRAPDRLQPHGCGCESRRGDYTAGVVWPSATL